MKNLSKIQGNILYDMIIHDGKIKEIDGMYYLNERGFTYRIPYHTILSMQRNGLIDNEYCLTDKAKSLTA